MRWRVITAIILLAVIFLGGLAARSWAKNLCLRTAQPLEALEAQLQNGQFDPDLLSLAKERWESGLPLLSSLITHDRLEQASRLLAQAEGFLWMGDLDECSAQLQELRCLLEAISQYDRLSLQTVF